MDRITLRRLSRQDRVRLKNSSKIADALELEWQRRISAAIDAHTRAAIEELARAGRVTAPDLEDLFCEHFFEVSIRAIRYAMSEVEPNSYLPKKAGRTLARVPKIKIPDSLRGIMSLYDRYRKGLFRPKRPVVEAREIQKEYLKRVRSVWERHSEDFRTGNVATQDAVVKKIRTDAATTVSRAKTIVRTSTTSYYNQARKNFYDESPDILHYLFIAIRDAATSPWCTPLTTNGFRGRSGLVYAKSDPLCAKETPACHPNCRSEFIPLSRLNPAHLAFIQNESIQRRNHSCYPLLKGWKGS